MRLRSKNDSILYISTGSRGNCLNAPFPNTNFYAVKIQAMHHSFEFIDFCDIIFSFSDTRSHTYGSLQKLNGELSVWRLLIVFIFISVIRVWCVFFFQSSAMDQNFLLLIFAFVRIICPRSVLKSFKPKKNPQ